MPQPGDDWTEAEVTLVVADYFDMLKRELLNQPYSKAEHNARLRQRLTTRSKGSVEFKHQNISAVLISLGYPYIDGYKPRSNVQGLLFDVVDAYLTANSGLFQDLATAPRVMSAVAPPVPGTHVNEYFVPAPAPLSVALSAHPARSRRGRRIDFVELDARNRELGRLGEQFVVGVEHRVSSTPAGTTWRRESNGFRRRRVTGWASMFSRSTRRTIRNGRSR